MQKQQASDSAFTLMFRNEEYVVQLYQLLTGKKLDPAKIKSVNLRDSLIKPKRYNDVSFLTENNQLLVLIEAQKTPSRNMAFRLLEYYVSLAGRFIKKHNQNRFGTKEVEIPKAQFLVVYNGKGKMRELSTLDLGDVQVKATVHNIHFDTLGHHDGDNVVAAYSRLVKLVEDRGLFINDALDQLLEEGYLPEFFGREEVRDMFAEVFSYDQELIDFGIEQGIEQTAKKLLTKGMTIKEVLEITELPLDVVQGLVVG